MIPESDIEKALDYMRDNATKAAKARAERAYMEEYRKVVKAQIMRENDDKALGAQEAIAYVEADEYNRWMLTAAEAKIEAWRTQCSNQRANI
jgi:hypothetical protein